MPPEIGVLIYTHNRVDDARINMEIVRDWWKCGPTKVVHAYNGKPDWYPKKYLEDTLVTAPNAGHFQGAADLIDAGMGAFEKYHPQVNHVVVLAADTWILKPDFVAKVVDTMKSKGKKLASACWGLAGKNDIFIQGIATDFFVVDRKWATKNGMFPIDYSNPGEVPSRFLLGGHVMLEKLAFKRFVSAVEKETELKGKGLRQAVTDRLHLMTQREPVHSGVKNGGRIWVRNFECPEIGLVSHHEPGPKRQALIDYGVIGGEFVQKLKGSKV